MTDEPRKRRTRTNANREGRIYQRSSDGRWVGVVWPPKEIGGKPRYVYGRSYAEAKEKKDAAAAEFAAGLAPTGRDVTVAAWFEHWLTRSLPQQLAAGQLAQSTLDSYTDNARKHILPDLGAIQLRRLAPSRVRQWQADLLRKPSGRPRKKLRPGETELPPAPTLSPRTVAYCHGILRAALNDAMRDELVQRNVVTLVQPPGRSKAERQALTKQQMQALLDASSSGQYWCYWLVVLTLGLRRGEGLGITWADVDFEAKTIRIAASVQRIRGEPDPETGRRKGRLVRKGLKTASSAAILPAGDGLIVALEQHQREQRAARMRSRVWLDADLVFATTVGTAIEPRNLARAWDKVCEGAGVTARIHDLRHACGTYLAAAGIHQRAIQAQLRHARMSTTEIYVHALAEMNRDAAEAMDAVVTELRRPSRRTRESS